MSPKSPCRGHLGASWGRVGGGLLGPPEGLTEGGGLLGHPEGLTFGWLAGCLFVCMSVSVSICLVYLIACLYIPLPRKPRALPAPRATSNLQARNAPASPTIAPHHLGVEVRSGCHRICGSRTSLPRRDDITWRWPKQHKANSIIIYQYDTDMQNMSHTV